ncbi:uncharacterized protein METZ01_LOCUS45622 [marine metagenome]|uniref:Uncharacterized protein n=1 Tax=marine metagenome TaxID=408172 RepID=A0A381RP83_9ZZZZ
MAHFAKLGSNSKVIQVLTLNNGDMLNADGVEDETVGQQYLERHNNWPAQMWIQTSYNTRGGKHSSGDDSKALRGNYAGIGYIWDEDNNLFYGKKPYASWVLNTTTASWHSPIGDAPALTDEQKADTSNMYSYSWNEEGQSWDLVTTPTA